VLVYIHVNERSISEDSLRRYVSYASESCIQELLAASDSGRGGDDDDDGWKVLAYRNGVEIARRRTGPGHVFRSRWLLQDVSPAQFMAVANAVDAAKVRTNILCDYYQLNKYYFASSFHQKKGNYMLYISIRRPVMNHRPS
jgi:hypothetical protein